jgi:CHAT domain-containing protein
MQHTTIYLQATREEQKGNPESEKSLRMCIKDEHENPMKSYKVRSFNKNVINDKCLEINEILNINSKKGDSLELYEQLKMKGRSLCDDLLTPEHKKELRKTKASYLILDIDDHLVHIPWELLFIDNCFLCERFAVGRLVKTRQDIVESEKRRLSLPLKMWILANPNGDLASAASEGLDIFTHMNLSNGKTRTIEAILESHITLDQIKDQIRNYDILHFAGHATYDSQEPGNSGWKLSEKKLGANDIKNMAGGKALPAIVFSNACQSAKTDEWDIDKIPANSSFGLANAFMHAGARHYIGTFGKIPDPSGGKFAQLFYDQLNASQSIGMALRNARQLLKADSSSIWANYLMYGDPREIYIDHTPESNSPIRIDDHSQHKPGIQYEQARLRSDQSQANEALTDKHLDSDPEKINQQHNIQQNKTTRFSKNIKIAVSIMLIVLILFGSMLYRNFFVGKVEDEWTSKPMTMAVVFNAKTEHVAPEKANILCQSIMMELKAYARFILLERIDIDILKEELDLWMSNYVTSEKKIKPDLYQAQFLLIIDVKGSDKLNQSDDSNEMGQENATIFIRLLSTQKGKVIKLLNETLNPGSILAQRQRISSQLIGKLKERYPRRGIITRETDKQIEMNIGSHVGVQIGQQYKVLKGMAIFEVDSVALDISYLKFQTSHRKLMSGWKVVEVSN